MKMEETIRFLLKAKKATYAGKGPELLSSRPKAHDLEYVEKDLRYMDTYLGGEKFLGEEVLWRKNIPFWAMNYCGRVISEEFNGNFLKEALLNVNADMPFRGPSEYKSDNFTYKCKVDGSFEWFMGSEQIFYNEEMVYECMFHGGIVK
ncbi:MAG: hypothetical protein H7Y18_13350 [Clostridiaceae bacterium]|nr:hypothetical protein [Clostridiaceae bacterium]